MPKVRVGFIGCGAVSDWHYQSIQQCSQAELAGIYDPDTEKMLGCAAKWNVSVHYSIADLLSNRSIDAIFVLSPVEYHHEHVMAALHSGKHVLVEKPVANTVEQIEEMDLLARQKGLMCMPGHNYIYSPSIISLKKNLVKGNLGKIAVSWILYHIHHSEQVASRYPGIIRQIGTHLLYTHRYLFGASDDISAHATRLLYPQLQREDQVMMTLTMPDGSLGNLFASFAVSDISSNPWTFLIKVLGTQGSTQMNWQDSVFENAAGTMSRTYSLFEDTYETEIDYFINNCIINGDSPLSTLEDAKEVLKLVELAETSVRKPE